MMNCLETWPEQRGAAIVLSGPSGAGKTTIYQRFLANHPEVHFSVSCTTRHPRVGEVDGQDYRFMDCAEFRQLVETNAFLEHAEVHGDLYGTLREYVVEPVGLGQDVLLDVDVQGARQIRECVRGTALETCALFVFCGPPSFAALEKRLRKRGTEREEVIQRRLAKAKEEMRFWREYDFLLINDRVEDAALLLATMVDAFRHRTVMFTGEIWHDV